jgi:pimeloyl-ACP methyl ester carboxylesterase
MKHLLLLHGAIGSSDQLKPLADQLKEHFIIHTLDFSGHGSAEMTEAFSIEVFADDVLSYLEKNNIEKVNIFGYSMGGYVALYLAKHYPERVNAVFTFATKFLWSPEIAAKEIKMLDPEKISEKLPAFAKALETRHAPNDWKVILKKTTEMMTRLGNTNLLNLNDYHDIQQRVQIGIGDKDIMATMEETIDVYRKLSKGSLIVFPDTPHPIEKIDVIRLKTEIISFFKN